MTNSDIFTCGTCMYFTNGHIENNFGIYKYCGNCDLYKMEVDSKDACSNGVFLVMEDSDDDR